MPTRDTAPVGAPCWIDIATSDTEKTRSFYGELFGWEAQDPNPEFGGYANFTRDGVLVAGCMGSDGSMGPTDTWSVYLASADAQATADAAAANGGTVVVPPMAVGELGTMVVLLDAAGGSIGAWQPGTHKGFGVLAEPGAPAWFELHTRDYDRSVAFYETVFGWDTHVQGDSPEFRYTTLGEGEGQLAGVMDGSGHMPEGAPPEWAVYFAVEDTDKGLAKAVELGGAVVDPAVDTPYGRLAVATDSTGARFRLVAGM